MVAIGAKPFSSITYCEKGDRILRQNVNSLKEEDKKRLRSALEALIKKGRYQDVANFHGEPKGICPERAGGFCCPHGITAFLAWHRLYVAQIEEELGEPLPYWDWTEDAEVPDLWDNIKEKVQKI